jgi:hypothetical protein
MLEDEGPPIAADALKGTFGPIDVGRMDVLEHDSEAGRAFLRAAPTELIHGFRPPNAVGGEVPGKDRKRQLRNDFDLERRGSLSPVELRG